MVPISPLITVLIPWLVTPAALPPSPEKVAAVPRLTGPIVNVPVVNVHGFGTEPLTSALPARSLTPVIVAVNVVLGGKLLAGLKVAILLATL